MPSVFDKSKLPSRHVTEGAARAPHRSYYYAMGLRREEIAKPFIGVVSCWNEAGAVQYHADASGAGGQAGGEAGGGDAARILHDHGDGWHRHGA